MNPQYPFGLTKEKYEEHSANNAELAIDGYEWNTSPNRKDRRRFAKVRGYFKMHMWYALKLDNNVQTFRKKQD